MNKSPFHTSSKRLDRICAAVFLAVMIVACFLRVLPYKSGQNTRQPDVFVKLQNTDGDKRVRFLSEPFSLKKGIYTLQYDSNIAQETEVVLGNFNRLQTETDVDIEDHIQFLPFRVTGQAHREIRILAEEDIPEAALLVREFYEGNGSMQADVQASLVYRPALSMSCYALDTILCFAVLAVLLHYIFHGCKNPKNPERWIPLFLFALTVLISLPLFRNYVTYGHDTVFHVRRIANLAEELFSGRIPARLAQTWKNGYGYPVSIFYGDIFMVPAAVLFQLGVPLFRCYQFHALLMNTLTVLLSYHCFRVLSGNPRMAVLGSVLYAGSVRYAANLYLRGAIGEDMGMAVMPLVVLGFAYLFGESDMIAGTGSATEKQGPKMTRQDKAIICLIIGFTALLQTHTLTTIQVTVFACLFCVCNIRILPREKRLAALLYAAGITALLNLWFIVPFLDYYARHRFYAKASASVADTAVRVTSLFSPEEPFQAIGVATAGILILCVCVWMIVYARKRGGKNALLNETLCLLLLSALAVMMGTTLFPWAWMEAHLPALYGLLGGRMQYVWRYFSIATLLVCVTAMLLARVVVTSASKKEAAEKKRKDEMGADSGLASGVYNVYVVFLLVLAVIGLFQSMQVMNTSLHPEEEKPFLHAADVWNGDGGDALYMFDDLVWYEMPPDTVTAGEGVTFVNAVHEGTAWQADAENTAEEESYIEFPVWNYYGYRAKLEPNVGTSGPSTGAGTGDEGSSTGAGTGSGVGSGTVVDGEQHRVRVLLPAGFSGHVSMRFQEPWYWRAAETVSVLTILLLCGILCYRSSTFPVKRAKSKTNNKKTQ